MNINYLFPHKYRRIGWLLFIPAAILGTYAVCYEWQPDLFDVTVPAFFIDELFGEEKFFGLVETNILNEIFGFFTIIGLLLIAFSKEKQEDEYILKVRLESLVWAVYLNYIVLLVSLWMFYDMAFFWVMLFNMFTILVFFIVRFNMQLSRAQKSLAYEK